MINAKKVRVVVTASPMTVISKVVFEHEVEIFEEIYGQEKVKITDPDEYDTENKLYLRPVYKGEKPEAGQPPAGYSATWPVDINEEYGRLQQVYGNYNERSSYAEQVFGSSKRSRIKEYDHAEDVVKVDSGKVKTSKKEKLRKLFDDKGMDWEGMTIKEMEDTLAELSGSDALQLDSGSEEGTEI